MTAEEDLLYAVKQYNRVGTVKLAMGDWVISKPKLADVHQMYHLCSEDKNDVYVVLYTGFSAKQEYRQEGPCRWVCGICSDEPPEALIATYMMLETEYAYSRMKFVTDLDDQNIQSEHPCNKS
jgi:hypothetical protein